MINPDLLITGDKTQAIEVILVLFAAFVLGATQSHRHHGGLDRWNKFKKVTATYIGDGGLWPMKGLGVFPHPIEVTVTLHEETSSISPFGQTDWHVSFMTGCNRNLRVTSSGSDPIQEHLL